MYQIKFRDEQTFKYIDLNDTSYFARNECKFCRSTGEFLDFPSPTAVMVVRRDSAHSPMRQLYLTCSLNYFRDYLYRNFNNCLQYESLACGRFVNAFDRIYIYSTDDTLICRKRLGQNKTLWKDILHLNL